MSTTAIEPVDPCRVVHALCERVWRAIITAHEVAHELQPLAAPDDELPDVFPSRTYDADPIGPWGTPNYYYHLNLVLLELDECSAAFSSWGLSVEPFDAPAAFTAAGIRETSAHALCVEAMKRVLILLQWARGGRTPILPGLGEGYLTGTIQDREPSYHSLQPPVPHVPYYLHDLLLAVLVHLFVRTPVTDGRASSDHALHVAREVNVLVITELRVEWERLQERRRIDALLARPAFSISTEATLDGPFAPDGLRYKGVEARFGRGSKRYTLITALWDGECRQPASPRDFLVVFEEIYGTTEGSIGKKFDMLCTSARAVLEKANFPLTIRNVQGKVGFHPV